MTKEMSTDDADPIYYKFVVTLFQNYNIIGLRPTSGL